MELINREVKDLGDCVIDVYRQAGDLYPSWDIVPVLCGAIERFPDARYGVNQPEDPAYSCDNPPPILRLFEVIEKWDDNGHTKNGNHHQEW